jgi:hypothetical protein
MKFAHLFDGMSPSGDPLFAADHPRTEDPQERARLSQFLGGGHPVMRGTGRDLDWFDPERGQVVPIAVVTDGRWVWNVALEYYARVHGLLPESAFLNYIVGCTYVARIPTEEETEAAYRELRAAQSGPSPT